MKYIMSPFYKKQVLLFNFIIAFTLHAHCSNIYDDLDKTIEQRHTYYNRHESKINKLKRKLFNSDTAAEKYNINYNLFIAYEKYNCDSALKYLNCALINSKNLTNKSLEVKAKLNLIFLYSSSGAFEEGIELLNSISANQLSDELKLQYFITCESLYGELKRIASEKQNIEKYEIKRKLFEDSILLVAPYHNERALKIREASYLSSKKYDKALKINNYRLNKTPKNDPKFSIIAFDRFLIEREMQNFEGEKKYLILSVICDIQNAVRDNASLSSLANILHSEGEFERAYKYIKIVQEDVAFYHARLRFIQVSSVMPIIEESFRIKSESQKKIIISTLFVISGLAGILLLSLLFIAKQKRKLSTAKNNLQQLNDDLLNLNEELHKLNHELSMVNQIKEEYIGQFLKICSVYIDKMDLMRRSVIKNISSNKNQETLKSIYSEELIDKEILEFYKHFDTVFLNIFPSFIDDFNDLLIDSERIVLKKNELLNVELRIFALIRLGITDITQIAKLLRYSVNTIYNYRAKVKNKVKSSRDEFETTIMNIGAYKA